MRHLVVAGAGIGGLTAAIALGRMGCRVTVLERRPALASFGAGLQLAPNATRILARLGLLDAVRDRALAPRSVRIRRARDGADIVRLPLADGEIRYGGPFLLLHRADLQHVLAEAQAGAGDVDLRFGRDVSTVAEDREGVTVALAGAEAMLHGHGFVEARGVHARFGANEAGLPRLMAWRALVPDAALPPRFRDPDTNLWLGPAAHLVHYPLRGHAAVNVIAITPSDRRSDAATGDPWSLAGDPARLRHHLRHWHTDATRLVDGAPHWRCWPLHEAEPLKRWGEGPYTRLGDAAHPMLPFLAQGASQAIEDAGALGSSLTEVSDVTAAFRRYERRRVPRAARVVAASRRQGELYHLARPASDARDLVMRTLGGRRSLAQMDWLYAPGR